MLPTRLIWFFLCVTISLPIFADQSDAARKSFQDTKAKADKGDSAAQLAVGDMYMNGLGTPIDESKGFKYHRKAAEKGIARAQYELGLDYANGFGVKEDEDEALTWYLKAAEQGVTEAQIAAGLCYVAGHGAAANGEQALKWFRIAADKGSAAAQFEIGKCYLEGTGVPKDPDEGARWIERAANGGAPRAQFFLGTLYERGIGVEKDIPAAYKWFALALSHDDAHAPDIRVSLAKAESLMSKEQIASAQRAAREFKPNSNVSLPQGGQGRNLEPTPATAGSSSQTGIIVVNAQDEDAEVFADGAFVGNSPATLKVKEGPHVIEVKKQGMADYRRELTITAGSQLNLRVHMAPTNTTPK